MKLRILQRLLRRGGSTHSWIADLTRDQRKTLCHNLKALLESKTALDREAGPAYSGAPNRSPGTSR